MPTKRSTLGAVVLLLFLAAGGLAKAEDTNRVFFLRAEAAYQEAAKKFTAATNPAAALELARSSFDYADLATNDAQRAEIARQGVAACRDWLVREPESAAAHYYLAMNLGELAQAEAPSLAAYRMVHEVEREFKRAAELDLHYDDAGPARNLGELYFQAPAWPLSVGSRHKAREWLERAAALAPESPENLLNLAEVQLQWHQPEAAGKTLRQLAAGWAAARIRFTGPGHERDWRDWNARRAAAEAAIGKLSEGGR